MRQQRLSGHVATAKFAGQPHPTVLHRGGEVLPASQQRKHVERAPISCRNLLTTGEAMPDREIIRTLFRYLWDKENGFRGRIAVAMGLLTVNKALNISVTLAYETSCAAFPEAVLVAAVCVAAVAS